MLLPQDLRKTSAEYEFSLYNTLVDIANAAAKGRSFITMPYRWWCDCQDIMFELKRRGFKINYRHISWIDSVSYKDATYYADEGLSDPDVVPKDLTADGAVELMPSLLKDVDCALQGAAKRGHTGFEIYLKKVPLTPFMILKQDLEARGFKLAFQPYPYDTNSIWTGTLYIDWGENNG